MMIMSKVIAREDVQKPVTARDAEDFSEKETFISLSSKKEYYIIRIYLKKPSNHPLWISLLKEDIHNLSTIQIHYFFYVWTRSTNGQPFVWSLS